MPYPKHQNLSNPQSWRHHPSGAAFIVWLHVRHEGIAAIHSARWHGMKVHLIINIRDRLVYVFLLIVLLSRFCCVQD